jgi:glycosyltransferase involved in cell wall biosynthesis
VLVYNEVESVTPLHEELMGVLDTLDMSFEIVYIDDGSRDGSTEHLGQLAGRDAHVRVVSFRRNFGQTAAVQAGIDHSRGEVLVFMDGDMQNDPHDIPRLLEKIDEGYDVVSGWRKNRRDDAARVLPSKIANWIIAKVTGVPLRDFGCTLKAYHREVIQDVKLYGEMHRFIPVYASMVGARITELTVNHRPRTFGKSKYSLSRTSRVLLDLITVKLLGSYSTKPIYFFGFAAFGLWAMALISTAAHSGPHQPAASARSISRHRRRAVPPDGTSGRALDPDLSRVAGEGDLRRAGDHRTCAQWEAVSPPGQLDVRDLRGGRRRSDCRPRAGPPNVYVPDASRTGR